MEAENVGRWYIPQRGDIVWRRHIIVLLPRLTLPILYGLCWTILAVGLRVTSVMSKDAFLIFHLVGMFLSSVWTMFHVDDWRDEMYILSRRENAIIFQSRHPFSWETGAWLRKEQITFTKAQLGIPKGDHEIEMGMKAFLWWIFGCGNVSIFGPSARVALTLADVFYPSRIKRQIDEWLQER